MNLAQSRAAMLADDAERHFSESPSKLWVPPAVAAIGGDNLGMVYEDEKLAFPDVPAPFEPLGSVVLVMLRQPPMQRALGLLLGSDTRRTERDKCQVGKVVAMGALAFRDRKTMEYWPEGAWCQVGDYVRVPLYQGDRTVVKFKCEQWSIDPVTEKKITEIVEDTVEFVGFKDLAILGRYKSAEQALAERAYL